MRQKGTSSSTQKSVSQPILLSFFLFFLLSFTMTNFFPSPSLLLVQLIFGATHFVPFHSFSGFIIISPSLNQPLMDSFDIAWCILPLSNIIISRREVMVAILAMSQFFTSLNRARWIALWLELLLDRRFVSSLLRRAPYQFSQKIRTFVYNSTQKIYACRMPIHNFHLHH